MQLVYTCMRTTCPIWLYLSTLEGFRFRPCTRRHAPMQVRYFAYMATHACMPGISMILDVVIGVYMHAWALPAQLGPPSATSRVVCFWSCTRQPCTNACVLLRTHAFTHPHAHNLNASRGNLCMHKCARPTEFGSSPSSTRPLFVLRVCTIH